MTIKKSLALCALLFVSGCRQEKVFPIMLPAGPADVHTAPQKISVGMSEAQVQGRLGKCSWADRGSSSYQGTITQHATLFYENPAQKPDIFRIHLKNDKVEEAEVLPYPTWARNRFPMATGTPKQVKSLLGNPSRTATTIRSGVKTTYWIYTDKIYSKKTLVVGFEDGTVRGCALGPNREDWDNGKLD